jgi:uncharacterized protein (AIM24 family)
MYFTRRLTTGFFGGEGFVLQRLLGDGLVLLKGGGATIVKKLEAAETLRVSTGSIIAFQNSVHYDVQMIKGGKNILFVRDPFFLFSCSQPPGRRGSLLHATHRPWNRVASGVVV